MRVALVHDWLTGMRGGERVLEELARRHPDADLYTLVHVPGTTSPEIERLSIHASPLSRLPGVAGHYRKLLPFFPWAMSRFRHELEQSRYDLVISCSHAVAKAIPIAPGQPHLCYCLTPMRYVWDHVDSYQGRGVRRMLALPLSHWLRARDRASSSAAHVTRFVGISTEVVDRIRRHYGRDAVCIHPPVDVARVVPDGAPPDDFYLLVGGFVPYKREDVAIDAFAKLGSRLVVVGDGPSRPRLQADAPANVEFTGRISDEALARLYARCRALIHPQDEDFGIAAVEAQAAGRPVIALGRGGARDTVVPLASADGDPSAAAPTGLWFDEQTPDALAAAVRCFEKNAHAFDPDAIRAHAERFSPQRFHAALDREAALAAQGQVR